MKNLFGLVIFLLLAFPAFGEELPFLTNQNSVQTTQFGNDDEIYIEGICLPANQEPGKIYITSDKIWQTNDQLFDISGGIETFAASSDGRIPRTKIWNKPPSQGTYDVAIDTNNDLILQEYEKQCVIGLIGAGFRVGNPPPPAETTPPPSSPPASPPPASPPPSAKPSKSFSLGEYVETDSLSNVRKSAGGTAFGTQAEGALGIVIGGPTQASLGGKYFWFWKIDFKDDPDGWVSESNLKSAAAPQEEVAVEETVATTSPSTEANAIEEKPKEETANEKMLAQVSTMFRNFGSNPLMGSIIIGAALFFGLVLSSIIISRAIRPPSRRQAQRQLRRQVRPQARQIDILPPEKS